MYNCLIISKSRVAFQDVIAVINACPWIFLKLFTVNKVKVYCKSDFLYCVYNGIFCLSFEIHDNINTSLLLNNIEKVNK